MKNRFCFILACALTAFTSLYAQTNTFPATGSAGIGTTAPHASSALDITSTTQGVLIPRMTKAQRNAITSPATGLLIFQTNNSPGLYFFSGTGWTAVTVPGNAWSLTGNAGTVPGTNFIGTTDAQPLMFKVNNNKAGYIDFDATDANTGFGYQTLFSLTTGFDNTANGYSALYSNTTGNYNTANGNKALYSNSSGSQNTASGHFALNSNTAGNYNTATGDHSLYHNTTGDENTATGDGALYNNTSGYNNTANGNSALYHNTTGRYNTASGYSALYWNNTGENNIANGYNALNLNTTGSNNVATGYNSLYSNSAGNGNTANGRYALYSNITGNNNTAIGSSADVATDNLTNATAIGYLATVDASNKVRLGNSSVSSNGGQVSWSTYSDGRIKNDVKENVPGLEFINELRPVTFHYDVKKENELLGVKDAGDWEGKYDIEKIQFTGFIAQDVEAAAQKIGYDFSGVDKSGEVWGLRYSDFVVPMVKAMQEVDQENQRLKTENREQQKQIDELKASIAILQSSMSDGYAELKTLKSKPETILGQNIPNPFDNSTLIPFHIPKDCKDASIMITNISSSEVISVIPISCNEDHVSIDAGVLASGMYSYTLYVDGKMIDTRSMELLK